MNFKEIVKTKRWKTFMGYVYGWGASIVLIGALFKLEHLPYSGYILAVGLLTEAFIFFISVFEPTVEQPDWGKVYPELKEDYEIIDFEEVEVPQAGKLDKLLSDSDITPELISKVSKGLNDLSNTARGISDISTATLATEIYVNNLGAASDSMNNLAQINNKANDSINSSVDDLVNSYSDTTKKLSDSGLSIVTKLNEAGEKFTAKVNESSNLLSDTYNEASKSLIGDLKDIGKNSKQYSSNLEQLNSNINALNNSFASQLKGTDDQFKATQQFNSDLKTMNEVLSSSVDEIKKYKDNAEQLNKHLEALNSIYGGMLGAMNYKK